MVCIFDYAVARFPRYRVVQKISSLEELQEFLKELNSNTGKDNKITFELDRDMDLVAVLNEEE